MRAKDIAIGEVHAVGKRSYNGGIVRGIVEENLGDGLWRVRFEEEMLYSWGYSPANGREPSPYERLLSEDTIPSRLIISLWDKYLADVAEEERQEAEEQRLHQLAQEASDRLAKETSDLLSELGCDLADPNLRIDVCHYGDYGTMLTIPLDICETLFKMSGTIDQMSEEVSKLFVGTRGIYTYPNSWSERHYMTLGLPLDGGEVFLDKLRAIHRVKSDNSGGSLIESLLSSSA